MPVDFTQRPPLSGRRLHALRAIICIFLVIATVSFVWSAYTGNIFGMIFPVLTFAFWVVIFPGMFKDFFNWIRGKKQKQRFPTWEDRYK